MSKVDQALDAGVAPEEVHRRLFSGQCVVCGGPAAFTGNWCAYCGEDEEPIRG